MRGTSRFVVILSGAWAIGASIVLSPAVAQPPATLVAGSREDSAALHRRARVAVDQYEVFGFRYYSAASVPDSGTGGSKCELKPGGPRCILGRDAPCPAVRWPFRCGDWTNGSNRYNPTKDGDVALAQLRLFEVLDVVSTALPGDMWVLREHVFQLANSGATSHAVTVAARCRAAPVECALLRAYAFARNRDVGRAETAIEEALTHLPPADRCAWDDVSSIAEESLAEALRSARCGATEGGSRTVWLLADPSWLVPGNDRRVEHYARQVDRRIQDAWGGYFNMIGVPNAFHFGNGMVPYEPMFSTKGDAILRDGRHDTHWVSYHTATAVDPATAGTRYSLRVMDSSCGEGEGYQALAGQMQAGSIHLPGYKVVCARTTSAGSRYHFLPSPSSLLKPFAAEHESWSLSEGPRPGLAGMRVPLGADGPPPPERHTPPYAWFVTQLQEWQVGYFRRGDSARVVGAFDVSRDSLFAELLAVKAEGKTSGAQWSGGMFAFSRAQIYDSTGTSGTRIEPRRSVTPTVGRVVAAIASPWDSLLVGLETLVDRDTTSPQRLERGGLLGRVRFGISPPAQPAQRVQLSDVLLYEPRAAQGGLESDLDLEGPGGAESMMLASTILRSKRSVGIFWEIYGVTTAETVRYTLTATPLSKGGGLGGVLGRLFGGGPRLPVNVQWSSTRPPASTDSTRWSRGMVVGLGSLEPGRYRLTLTAGSAGQEPVSVSREITVAKN